MTNKLFEIIVFTVTVLLTNWFFREASIFFIIGVGLTASFIVKFMFHGKYGNHQEKVLFSFVGKRNIEKRHSKGYQMFDNKLDSLDEGALHSIEIYKKQVLPILEKSDYNVQYRKGPNKDEKGLCEEIAMKNNAFTIWINIYEDGELKVLIKNIERPEITISNNALAEDYGKRQALFNKVIEIVGDNKKRF